MEHQLEGLVPHGAVVAVADLDAPLEPLYPAEEVAVARAIEKRRREFIQGRTAARAALARLGVAAGPIPVAESRAPIWPDGVVGSITHCAGLVAAVVAWRRDLAGIGVDAEMADRSTPDIARLVCTAAERQRMAEMPPPGVEWPKLFFCAKEAVYKAVAPIAGSWVGFQDVEIDFDPKGNRFDPRFVGPPPTSLPRPLILSGRFSVSGGLVLTVVAMAANEDASTA